MWLAPAITLGAMLVGDTLLYAVLPTSAASLGFTSFEVGVLLAANRLVRLGAMPAVVRQVRASGTATVLSASVLIAAVSHFMMAAGAGFGPLLLARMGWGVAYAIGNLTMLDAAASDAQRVGRRIGTARAVSRLPALVALVLAPSMMGLVGLEGLFLGAGMLALAGLPFARRAPARNLDTSPAPFGWPTNHDRLLAAVALAVDGVLVTCAGSLFSAGPGGGVLAAATVLAGLRIADLFLCPLAGLACDRGGARRVLRAGLLGLWAGLVLIGLGVTWGVVSVVLCRPWITPAIHAVVRRSSQEPSLVAVGRLATWRDVGAAAGPLFALVVLERFGREFLFFPLAILVAASARFLFPLNARVSNVSSK